MLVMMIPHSRFEFFLPLEGPFVVRLIEGSGLF